MPTSADELVKLLDLETIDKDLFRGQQPDTTRQRVFGGQVAGQALVAAWRTAPERMSMHSLHSYFMRPGDTSVPIVYDVHRVRDGTSFATRRVLARQHGEAIYAMTASFQIAEDGFEHQDAIPVVPAPEECVDLAELFSANDPSRSEEWAKDWAALDVRYVGDSRRGGVPVNDSHPALSSVWIKVSGTLPDDVRVQHAALTYLSDFALLGATLVPHGVTLNQAGMQVASLDHSVWFHRPFRADEWLLYEQASPSASGARGLSLGRLFTKDGRLVASTAQEGLIRLRPVR